MNSVTTTIIVSGCSQCGACCSDPANNAWIGGDEETDARLRTENGDCRFLARELGGKCRCVALHKDRPDFCVTYPYCGNPHEGCTAQIEVEWKDYA